MNQIIHHCLLLYLEKLNILLDTVTARSSAPYRHSHSCIGDVLLCSIEV